MPELPEVESLRIGLEGKIINSKILSASILKPKIVSGFGTKRKIDKKKINEFLLQVKNQKIKKIIRIAKNLIVEFASKNVLIIHLKMTGQLVFLDKEKNKVIGGHPILKSYTDTLPNSHTCIIFNLNNGTLFYNDVRMFGYVLFYKNLSTARKYGHFKGLGLDPLSVDFTLKYFKEELIKKNKNLKTVFLEQSVVNGLGNIYSDEVCFASKVLPTRNCRSLNDKEISEIYKNIKRILKLSIKLGGSSISDYLLADGKKGNFGKLLQVYGRAKEKCKTCKKPLKKDLVAGRTTVFCSSCQK